MERRVARAARDDETETRTKVLFLISNQRGDALMIMQGFSLLSGFAELAQEGITSCLKHFLWSMYSSLMVVVIEFALNGLGSRIL